MNKIEEILNNNRNNNPRDHASEWNEYNVISAMKEYAEWYAEKLRALIEDETWIDDFGEFIITQREIQNIKLPNHE